jgi:hypothetical protein
VVAENSNFPIAVIVKLDFLLYRDVGLREFLQKF